MSEVIDQLSEVSNTVDLPVVVLVVVICLAFGGLGGLAAYFVVGGVGTDDGRSNSSPVVFLEALKSVFVGGVGAIGFLFFTIAVGGIASQFTTLTEVLRTISTSVIAGFGARRLLPQMVDQLEQRMASVEEKANEAVAEASSLEKQSERLEVNINLKEAATGNASAALRNRAIGDAKKLIEDGKAGSATWVGLARVYRWNDKLESAIETLNLGLDAMLAGDVDNDNLAALYYNRGCYRALLYNENTSAQEKLKALADLDVFFEMASDPKHEAEIISEDSDWENLADDPQFCEIVGKRLSG